MKRRGVGDRREEGEGERKGRGEGYSVLSQTQWCSLFRS